MKNKVFFWMKKYQTTLIFMVVIALQLAVAALYMNSKQFMYIDEFYCFEGAHNALLYRQADPEFRLFTDEQWYDTWHTKEELIRHFEVHENESVLGYSLTELKSILKTKNIYYILLNIAESFQSDSTMTKWTGFILNSIFFVLHQIVFYLIGIEIFRDKRKAMLPMIIYGFSAGAISLITYIRFYIFKSLLCLFIAYIHMKLLEWRNIWGIIVVYGITGIAVLLIWGNQPYIVLYAASAVFVFMIVCLINKEYELLLKYIGIGGAGTLAVVLFIPGIVKQLSGYAASHYGVSTINNFLRRPMGEYVDLVNFYFMKTVSHVAEGVYNIVVILIILAIIWCVQKKNGKVQKIRLNYFVPKAYFMIAVSVCYFVINCRIQVTTAYRYMSCIYPGLCLGIAILLEWALESCQIRARSAVVCAVILTGLFFGCTRGYVDDMYPEISGMRKELARYPNADNLFVMHDEEIIQALQCYCDGYLSNDGTRQYYMKSENIEKTDYSFLDELNGEGFLCWFPIYYWSDEFTKRRMEQILVRTSYKEFERVLTTNYSNVYYVH